MKKLKQMKMFFNLGTGFLGLMFLLLGACSAPTGNDTKESSAITEETPENKTRTTESDMESEKNEKKSILIFGNSLTAGYGLEDPEKGFAGLIQEKIDALNLPYKVINGGISGETSSDGKGRIKWMMRNPVDIFILELGANDGLRGISTEATHKNLQFILSTVKESYPHAKILVTGMEVPPNMGDVYAEDFRKIFPQLAKDNDAVLMPFLLEGVAGEPELNQRDAIHPTEAGHKIVAKNLWAILKDMIEEVN